MCGALKYACHGSTIDQLQPCYIGIKNEFSWSYNKNTGGIYEKENIDTMDASGEILITILSSLAQQESQSISQNIRMGFQYRMQEGKGYLKRS